MKNDKNKLMLFVDKDFTRLADQLVLIVWCLNTIWIFNFLSKHSAKLKMRLLQSWTPKPHSNNVENIEMWTWRFNLIPYIAQLSELGWVFWTLERYSVIRQAYLSGFVCCVSWWATTWCLDWLANVHNWCLVDGTAL